ncbi:MAG: hypothetical protein QOJ39_2598 [Candidatus Eremiobacteraeota bacterium]|nr:hypothetical protein [Candidatus Eremiobacteraeota bacterium]
MARRMARSEAPLPPLQAVAMSGGNRRIARATNRGDGDGDAVGETDGGGETDGAGDPAAGGTPSRKLDTRTAGSAHAVKLVAALTGGSSCAR